MPLYTNHDYEPYAKERDEAIGQLLTEHDIPFRTFKDQVIFRERRDYDQIRRTFYKVFTPYKKSLASDKLEDKMLESYTSGLSFRKLVPDLSRSTMPSLARPRASSAPILRFRPTTDR